MNKNNCSICGAINTTMASECHNCHHNFTKIGFSVQSYNINNGTFEDVDYKDISYHATREIKELKQENEKLKNTNDSLLAENKMFIKSLENIIIDDFVADYQSELHRVLRIAREALGVK